MNSFQRMNLMHRTLEIPGYNRMMPFKCLEKNKCPLGSFFSEVNSNFKASQEIFIKIYNKLSEMLMDYRKYASEWMKSSRHEVQNDRYLVRCKCTYSLSILRDQYLNWGS